MAGEIAVDNVTGRTLYCNIRNRTSGYIFNGSTFESYSSLSGNQFSYVVSLTEQGTSAHYIGTMPSAIGAGTYDVTARNKLTGAYLESDPVIAGGQVEWNSAIAVPLSDTSTSGQVGLIAPITVYKGQMIPNFKFKLCSSADHVTPLVSGVCSGSISRDSGAFGPLQSGAFQEIGLGWYRVDLTSGDLNCRSAALVFTAVGVSGGSSDQRDIGMVLQRSSGSA